MTREEFHELTKQEIVLLDGATGGDAEGRLHRGVDL